MAPQSGPETALHSFRVAQALLSVRYKKPAKRPMHGSRAALEQSQGFDCNGGTGVALWVADTQDDFSASIKRCPGVGTIKNKNPKSM